VQILDFEQRRHSPRLRAVPRLQILTRFDDTQTANLSVVSQVRRLSQPRGKNDGEARNEQVILTLPAPGNGSVMFTITAAYPDNGH
jgi:hypothetical protein